MNRYTEALTRGIVKENPVFRLVLGTCPTLAVTTTALGGLGMGIAATFVLICSNIAISSLRKLIPDKVRLPAFIVLIAGFTTIVQLLVKAFVPALDQALGIYLPLIVVNCIILGRAEAFASKNTVALSALDGVGMGCGFTASLTVMGTIRELLGNGTVFGWPENGLFPAIAIFVLPAGGFFVFGMLIWLINKLSERHAVKPLKTEFGCEGCVNRKNCEDCAGGAVKADAAATSVIEGPADAPEKVEAPEETKDAPAADSDKEVSHGE